MTRIFTSDYRESKHRNYPDPFPVEKLGRVDRPTTAIHDEEVRRVDERNGGFYRAGNGEYGDNLQKEYKRFVPKHPLSGALVTMTGAHENINLLLLQHGGSNFELSVGEA